MKRKFLILHNIRSVHNTGSLFRTADALGIDKIYLTGYTPNPLDKYGRKRKDFHKSALGAEESIKWEKKKNLRGLIKKLKKEGFQIIAIEQSEVSKNYRKIKPQNNTAFILGNEVRGLSKNVLQKADVVAEIPMKGKKKSLNVSVAGGIAISRILEN